MMINGKYPIDKSLQRHTIYTVADNSEIALDVMLQALEESTEASCLDYEIPIDLSLTREIKS
tara:strand:- start:6644 stop:6829 length:186 start_codon:yes stop_codon:yes gene_type:complete